MFMDWAGAIATYAAMGAGEDGNSCSIVAMGCADVSLLMGDVVMSWFGCSLGRVSWATGVLCVVEGICDETSGCVCAVSVDDGVANSGLVPLDVSAMRLRSFFVCLGGLGTYVCEDAETGTSALLARRDVFARGTSLSDSTELVCCDDSANVTFHRKVSE